MQPEYSAVMLDNNKFYIDSQTFAFLLGLTRMNHNRCVVDQRRINRLLAELGVYGASRDSYFSEALCLSICDRLKDRRLALRFQTWLNEQKQHQRYGTDPLFDFLKLELLAPEKRWIPLPAAAKQLGVSRKDLMLFMISCDYLSCADSGRFKLTGTYNQKSAFRGYRGAAQVSAAGLEMLSRSLPQKGAPRG